MSTYPWYMLAKFKSALPFEEAMHTAESHMEDFRAVKGLQQK